MGLPDDDILRVVQLAMTAKQAIYEKRQDDAINRLNRLVAICRAEIKKREGKEAEVGEAAIPPGS